MNTLLVLGYAVAAAAFVISLSRGGALSVLNALQMVILWLYFLLK